MQVDSLTSSQLEELLCGWHTTGRPALRRKLLNTARVAAPLGDREVYARLHQIIKEDPIDLTYVSSESRARKRAKELAALLPSSFRFNALLDIGCADGSITSALGDVLRTSCTQGVDVQGSKYAEGRALRCKLSVYDGVHLPFGDASFDVVSAIMCLHHVREPALLLADIARVLKPGGWLLVREHDCPNEGALATKLDVTHGLYALVWRVPPEDPDFLDGSFYSNYQTQTEWAATIAKAGLLPQPPTATRGGQHIYTQAFVRLPSPWLPCQSKSTGRWYRYNPKTRESVW